MAKMSNERTPLLTTVTVGSVPRRYPHQTLRRFCTIALGSTLVALFITFLCTSISSPHVGQWPGHHRSHVTPEELQTILLETPSGEKAGEWSKYYTSGPHLAGKNLSQVCNVHEGSFLDH
jgi:N-acetylated-alpha-linked acidic dipeptidase